MKYIYSILLTFLFIIPGLVFASTEVYIYPVATDNSTYKAGDVIKGQFTIHNVRGERQSDVVYSIAVTRGSEPAGLLVGEKKYNEPLYLEANSKRNIPFEYIIPDSVSGKVNVVVTGFLTDGTVVAQGNAPILISGTPQTELLVPANLLLEVDTQEYDILDSVIMKPESEAFFTFILPPTTQEQNVTINTDLFNRVENDTVLKSLEVVSVQTSTTEDTYVQIQLPKNMDPLVYLGKVSFEIENYAIEPLYFRYTVEGPIATIRNINSNILSIKKNKKFDVQVLYAGTPIAPNDNQTEELQTEANLSLSAYNEKNELVAQSEQKIDLINQDTVSIQLESLVAAESLYFDAKIVDFDGKVLSTFSTKLPSEAELDSLYQKTFWEKNKTLLYVALTLFFIFIIVLVFSIFIRRKENLNKISLVIVVLALCGAVISGSSVLAQESSGYLIESGSFQPNGVELNALFSPLPASVRSYTVGELFDTSGDIRFGANLQGVQMISLFVPKGGYGFSNTYPPTNLANWTAQRLAEPSAWWNSTIPTELLNQNLLGKLTYSSYYDSNPSSIRNNLSAWVANNADFFRVLTSTGGYSDSGNFLGGDWLRLNDLNASVANTLLDLREIVYPTTSNKVFSDAVSLGYMVDTNEFEYEIQNLFARNTLGTVYGSCSLRSTLWSNGCVNGSVQGNVMNSLFPPVTYGFPSNESAADLFLSYPVSHSLLASKWRSYETGVDQKPFTFEINHPTFQTMTNYNRLVTDYYASSTRIRTEYIDDAELLTMAAKFMQDYQLTGWEDANSVDFGLTFTPKTLASYSEYSNYNPDKYTITQKTTVIDAIEAAEYNSPEFNTAVRAILNFLFYYNQKFYSYSQAYKAYYAYNGATPLFANFYTSFHSRKASSGFTPQSYTASSIIPPLYGMQKVYFYFVAHNIQNTAGEKAAEEALVAQVICISGGDLCPDEQDPLACPNLTIDGGPVYTEDENGVINMDGVATTLIKDGSGNCIEPPVICPNLTIEGGPVYTKDENGIIYENGVATTLTEDALGDCMYSCDDTYTEGQLICSGGFEYTMSCNTTNGTWVDTSTGNSCNAVSYCEADPVSADVDESVTFTAYPAGASYVWRDSNGDQVSTSRTYTNSFSSNGTYSYDVDVTTAYGSQTHSCSATVGVVLPPSPGVGASNFKFVPPIANSSGQCNLNLEAENVDSCVLTNRTGTDSINFTTASSTIPISETQLVDVGTWTLVCYGPTGTSTPVSRTCISNPIYREN